MSLKNTDSTTQSLATIVEIGRQQQRLCELSNAQYSPVISNSLFYPDYICADLNSTEPVF